MDMETSTHQPLSKASPARKLFLVGIACAAMAWGAMALDLSIAQHVRTDSLPGDLRRVFNLCELFAHGLGIALVAWCLWLVTPQHRLRIPRVILCAVVPGALVNLIKLFVVRCRPIAFTETFPSSVLETWNAASVAADLASSSTWYLYHSFPSGHTATAIGLAIGLSWLVPRGRLLFFTVAIMATAQRVISSAHWTSDTLAAAAVAFWCGAILCGRGGAGSIFHAWENRSVRGRD